MTSQAKTMFRAGHVTTSKTPPFLYEAHVQTYRRKRTLVIFSILQAIGHTGKLQNKGDFVTGKIAGTSYVVIRGDDMQLRAFHNVSPLLSLLNLHPLPKTPSGKFCMHLERTPKALNPRILLSALQGGFQPRSSQHIESTAQASYLDNN